MARFKPHIKLDAAVVGFLRGAKGVCEMLLALWRNEPSGDNIPATTGGHYQLIGRVSSGLSADEQSALLERLAPLGCAAPLPLASRNGQPYKWVRPEVVVEVRVHEILNRRGRGEKILRWALARDADAGWSPLGRRLSISLRDAVFVRRREDKSPSPAARGPLWFTLGKFDGEAVIINKADLRQRLEGSRNRLLAACPHFDPAEVRKRIEALPDKIEPSMDGWRVVYDRASGASAWVWPDDQPLPPALIVHAQSQHHGEALSER